MENNKFQYCVVENDKELLIKGLLKRRLGFSSRLMRKLKTEGGVYLNGIPARLNAPVCPGDMISVSLPSEESDFTAQAIPITPVYEDEDLLIINKQPGIVVHPTKGHPTGTIANGLMHYMEQTGQSFKIRFVNRLDMHTSGLLIVAKNSFSQDELSRQMTAGAVVKKYIAVVRGIIENDSGTIDLPIDRAQFGDVKRVVKEDGYPSITHYEVLERFQTGYTMVSLRLDSGRTHQIRVHMEHIGHPVVGDSLYGKDEVLLIERQALHAFFLSFEHPIRGGRMEIKAELPDDILELIRRVRPYT